MAEAPGATRRRRKIFDDLQLHLHDLDPPPLMLGFILGPMFDEYFLRALLLSRGSFITFVNRPIAGTLLGLIAVFATWQLIAFYLEMRKAKASGHPEPVTVSAPLGQVAEE